MPSVFGNQHIGHHRLGRQPALDQPFGRSRLHHRLLAGSAGIFGTMRHHHPELRRDHVEPLRALLADHMHRCPARGSWCLRARSSHGRAADGREARRDWRGACRRARERPPGPLVVGGFGGCDGCSISSSARAAAPDRASPNAAKLRALQLAQQMPQAIILRQHVVALRDRGIALRVRRRKLRLQRAISVGN